MSDSSSPIDEFRRSRQKCPSGRVGAGSLAGQLVRPRRYPLAVDVHWRWMGKGTLYEDILALV